MRSPGRFPRSVFSKIASLAREVRRAPRAANLSQELELQPPEPLSSRIPERDHWDITERWEKDAALLIINALDRSVCSVSSPVPGTCRTREDDRFRTWFYQKEKHHEHPSERSHADPVPNRGRNHYPLRRERRASGQPYFADESLAGEPVCVPADLANAFTTLIPACH